MRRFALLVISALLLAAAAGMATYWFASRAEERALWDKLEALPGVVSTSVVFTDFSDLVERKDIQE